MIDLSTLTADQREAYEERAAIREHDGKLSKQSAELLAWREITCR